MMMNLNVLTDERNGSTKQIQLHMQEPQHVQILLGLHVVNALDCKTDRMRSR